MKKTIYVLSAIIILMLTGATVIIFLLPSKPTYVEALSETTIPVGVITCNNDSDCIYIPERSSDPKASYPLLILLDCRRANWEVVDSNKRIADSLGWILATCHESKNHRPFQENYRDIIIDLNKYLKLLPVDRDRIYIFGFSGMGSQALITALLTPQLFKGVVAVCAHNQGLDYIALSEIDRKMQFYLVTRESDWNREYNETMAALFGQHGFQVKLITTPGEHGPGPADELFDACQWLNNLVTQSKHPD